MAQSSPDERLVYLAFKNTFKGADALIRKFKKIREFIQKLRHNVDITELIKQHSLDQVCDVAKLLLEKHIFESTFKAEARFPEVFEISPAQNAERTVSEADAIRSVVEGRNSSEPPQSSHDIQLTNEKALLTCP